MVAQSCTLRVVGKSRRVGASDALPNTIRRYSAAWRSHNQYDPTTDEHGWTRIRENLSSSVLIRVHPWLNKSSRAATISGDTDRLKICATFASPLNTYPRRGRGMGWRSSW